MAILRRGLAKGQLQQSKPLYLMTSVDIQCVLLAVEVLLSTAVT